MASQVLLITGGSSGIGQATAQLFAQRGWRVFEMSRHGASVQGVTHLQGDVTSADDCRQVVEAVIAEVGRIDVLICNAGMGVSGPVEFTPDEVSHHQLDVNFFGAVHIIQATLPHLRRQQQGRILIVSSLAAIFSIPFQAFYSASKAALNAMAMSLRNELAPSGIQVSCLMPGDVHTGFTAARRKQDEGSDVYQRLVSSVAAMERDEQQGQSPQRIALRLYAMACTRHLAAYYYVGAQYHLFAFLYKVLPATLISRILRMMY